MQKVFTFEAPAFEIIKSYRDGDGQMFIEGIAATTAIDLTGERMSPEVLEKMARNLIGKPLRSEHGKGWDDKLGTIELADVREDPAGKPALWIKARLFDWSSKAKDLFGFLKNEGVKMGLSVAGKINPGGLVKELVESVGKYIPTYRDVMPTEVSVTDHPANLDTFAFAVAKSLNLENYDPDEYANMLDAYVEKQMEKADEEGVTNANEKKPQEYEDVSSADFLDPENYKYPADEKHIMPALKYFNHEGQREKGGYDENKWSAMGAKLAGKLSKLTSDSYKYDPTSEKVIKGGGMKKTEEVKDDMQKKDHGNYTSKAVTPDVAGFIGQWSRQPIATTEVKKADEEKKDDVAKATPSPFSVVGGSSSSGSSDSSSSGSSDSSSSGSDSSSGSSSSTSSGIPTSLASEIESLMGELKSTLESIKDSMDSSGSSSSGSSDSSSSDSSDSSSSDDSSSGSSKTSTDKAMDSTSLQDSSSDSAKQSANGSQKPKIKKDDGAAKPNPMDDDTTDTTTSVARAIESLVLAANTLKDQLEKGNKPKLKGPKGGSADYSSSDNVSGTTETGAQVGKAVGKPKLKDQDSEEASDYSSSANAKGAGSTSSYGKSIDRLADILGKFEKSLEKRDAEFSKLVEKSEEAPAERKGHAWALEKNFQGYHDAATVDGVDPVTLEKIKNDKDIPFDEYYKYKHYGEMPKKYALQQN